MWGKKQLCQFIKDRNRELWRSEEFFYDGESERRRQVDSISEGSGKDVVKESEVGIYVIPIK